MSQKVLVFPVKSVFPDNWYKADQKAQTLRAINEIAALHSQGFNICFVGEISPQQEAFINECCDKPLGQRVRSFGDLFDKLEKSRVILSDVTVFYNPPGPGPLPEYHPFIRWLLVPQDMYRHAEAQSVLTWLQQKQDEGLVLVNYNRTQRLGITPKLVDLSKFGIENEPHAPVYTPSYQPWERCNPEHNQYELDKPLVSPHKPKMGRAS